MIDTKQQSTGAVPEAVRKQVAACLEKLSAHSLNEDCGSTILDFVDLQNVLITSALGSLDKMKSAVESALRTVGDYRELKNLEDREIAFLERMTWIQREFELADGKIGVNDEAEKWREYFQEDEYGTPRYLGIEYYRNLELGRLGPVISNLHQLGGMIDLLSRRISEGISPEEIAHSFEDLRTALLYHLENLKVTDSYEIKHDSLDQLLAEYRLPLKNSDQVKTTLPSIWSRYNDLYGELRKQAGLDLLPDGYQLVEYSALTTGLHPSLFEEVHQISEDLKIDPSLGKDQEGFGRSIPAEEVEGILSHRSAKLYGLQKDGQLKGFHTLLPELDSLPSTLIDAHSYLKANNMLPRRSRIGGCEIFGISKEARKELIEKKVSASDLMHEAMIESARSEQLDYLFAVCRAGRNANTASLNSHKKHGWEVKGEIIIGGTPYKVLFYDVASYRSPRSSSSNLASHDVELNQLTESILPGRPKVIKMLGDRGYFERDLDNEHYTKALSQNSISASAAFDIVKADLSTLVEEIDLLSLVDGACIMASGTSRIFAFRQLMPMKDYWSYEGLGFTIYGTIREVTKQVLAELTRTY